MVKIDSIQHVPVWGMEPSTLGEDCVQGRK